MEDRLLKEVHKNHVHAKSCLVNVLISKYEDKSFKTLTDYTEFMDKMSRKYGRDVANLVSNTLFNVEECGDVIVL